MACALLFEEADASASLTGSDTRLIDPEHSLTLSSAASLLSSDAFAVDDLTPYAPPSSPDSVRCGGLDDAVPPTLLDLDADAVLAALAHADCGALVQDKVSVAPITHPPAPPRRRRPRPPRARRPPAASPPPPPPEPAADPPRTRADAIALYRAKKAKRLSLRALPILYVRRKANADSRPRVGGRFVSREVAAVLRASAAAAAPSSQEAAA